MVRRVFSILTIMLCVSCDDKLSWIQPPPPPPITIPTVTSISPESGTVGTEITVTGTGFSETLSKNKVTVNGVEGAITQATTTTLVFTAPNTTTGAVEVIVSSQHAVNKPIFTYQ